MKYSFAKGNGSLRDFHQRALEALARVEVSQGTQWAPAMKSPTYLLGLLKPLPPPPPPPPTPEKIAAAIKQFIELAENDNIDKMTEMLAETSPLVTVQSKDPITSNTALHKARPGAARFFLQIGADMNAESTLVSG